MYILSFSFTDIFRTLFLMIDQIAFGLVDEVYDLIGIFASVEIFDSVVIEQVMKSVYTVMSLFALFRIALLLVNSAIDPDKLTEKGSGLASILKNLVIMLVLLVVVPFIFKESRELQIKIVNGNYIGKVFGFDFGQSTSTDKTGIDKINGGSTMKRIALSSVITIDNSLYNGNSLIAACDDGCKSAVSDYNKMMVGENDTLYKINFKALLHHLNYKIKLGDGSEVYVYDYSFGLSTVVGIFLTYILLTFALDIAIRTVELGVLEIISPIFIATYIDPKSAKSGPFHKWLSAVGKSYASLFIKLAIIYLMLLFISLARNGTIFSMKGHGFVKIVLLVAILIFFKKAPNMIMGMFGASGDDNGGFSLAKKLGSAALIGGAATAGIGAAKKFGKQKAKNFAGNRARNTLARIGGMKEAASENYKNRKNALSNGEKFDKNSKRSLWQEGRDAAKRSKLANYGQNISGLKDVTAGYLAGRQLVNSGAKSLTDTMKDRYNDKVGKYEKDVGLTADVRAKQLEVKKDNDKAKKLYGKLTFDSSGDRKKLAGRDAYLNPQGRKEMNKSFGNPLTTAAAYTALGLNLASDRNLKVGQIQDGSGNTVDLIEYGKNAISASGYKINDYGKVVDSSGNVISSSLVEYSKTVANGNGHVIVDENVRDANGAVVAANLENYGKENMSYSGTLAIEHLIAENKQSNVQRYQNSVQEYRAATSEYTAAVSKYNEVAEKYNNDPEVKNAYEIKAQMEAKMNIVQEQLKKLEESPIGVKYINGELESLSTDQINAYKKSRSRIEEDLSTATVEFETASATVANLEEKYDIKTLKANVFEFKSSVESWELEKKTAENLVKDYKITVDGEDLSPITNFARINEINNAISREVSKKKEKYDNSLKDSSSDGK